MPFPGTVRLHKGQNVLCNIFDDLDEMKKRRSNKFKSSKGKQQTSRGKTKQASLKLHGVDGNFRKQAY